MLVTVPYRNTELQVSIEYLVEPDAEGSVGKTILRDEPTLFMGTPLRKFHRVLDSILRPELQSIICPS
ncbi:unnamed protein product [Protopolystoma xenopodis]|uniref:Uncharacterized protein n=1 Tax=Protopolystoma xenopodis TaxID=117903 RepID=A0A3S4ZXM8_9PLAT|nr:unnamed protein product [Protopolystoma xenopodis]